MNDDKDRIRTVRTILKMTFESYVDFGMCLVTPVLRLHPNNGFPLHVLEDPTWNPILLLALEAKVFDSMCAEFHDDHVSCNLSFDRLYAVEIPYACIAQLAPTFPVTGPAPIEERRTGFVPRVVQDEEEN
jgi:hypothetical protein